jgi:hypothetical protein
MLGDRFTIPRERSRDLTRGRIEVSKIWKNRKGAVEVCARAYLARKMRRCPVYDHCRAWLDDPVAVLFVDSASLSGTQRSRFIFSVIKWIHEEDTKAFPEPLDRVPRGV